MEAVRLARESCDICREQGDRFTLAHGAKALGLSLRAAGQFTQAASCLRESLSIYSDVGHRNHEVRVHAELSEVHLHLGRFQEADALARTSLAQARERDLEDTVGRCQLLLGSLALAGGAHFEAREALQGLAQDQRSTRKVDLAVILTLLGSATCGAGDQHRARRLFADGLGLGIESGSVPPLLWALPMIALFLLDQGEAERAVEAYALASRYDYVANSRWFEAVAGRAINAAAGTLSPHVAEAARERGRLRDLHATAEELLDEMER
jgi:tetratricopeptide (TPR) repeat protein